MANIRRGRRAAGGFVNDFKEFALKGNIVDLAIAVIIGGAFGKIITALVEDVIMPFLNPILSVAGSDWREATVGPGVRIGSFFSSIVDFLLIALALFLIIRAFARFKREEEVVEAPTDPVVTSQENLTTAVDRLTETINASRNL
jgi:large conductance mechanosensitive channel